MTYTKKVFTISKIVGQSIYLDDLTKPFKAFELVKAVGSNAVNSYDKLNAKDKAAEKIKRVLRKGGI
jgi:hypothetical protein